MASIHQIRGILLEEVILFLLRTSGYQTVTNIGNDPTLGRSSAGLTVSGRGSKHQIDAIADLKIGHPFGNPQRLLVEAKAYADHRPIGLPIIRNTVGVLKDVSEYWVSKLRDNPSVQRYHYQAAIFSTSEFTSHAQDFAYAHDVYLLPLRRSQFIAPLIESIDNATEDLDIQDDNVVGVDLNNLRQVLRRSLQPRVNIEIAIINDLEWLIPIIETAEQLEYSLIATIGRSFHVLLTPDEDVNLEELDTNLQIEIYFTLGDIEGWTITDRNRNPLFTFDLPDRLFQLYSEEGKLSRSSAANLKEEYFNNFTALYSYDDQIRVFNFRLREGWIEEIRNNLSQSNDT